MCRGKIVADSGSPNVKLTKMTWNKESIQYRISFSQASYAMRTRSTVKLARHSKNMRSVRRKRKQSTIRLIPHQSKPCDTLKEVDAAQCFSQVVDTVASPAAITSPIMKRSATIRKTPAFRRPSEYKRPFGMQHDGPPQTTVPVNGQQEGDSVDDEEAIEYQLRYQDISIETTPADMEHSLDPSQITIEIEDNVENTPMTQTPYISDVEQQLHMLHSLKTDYEEEVELQHATSTVTTRGSILNTSTSDSGVSSLNTSLESTSSITTDGSYNSGYPQRQPRSAAKKPRSPKRRVRVRRRPRKLMVAGDMCSGKSSIVSAYCRDRFSENYLPTILNCCFSDAEVFGEKIELVLIDVSGRDDYKRLRECAYHKVDAVILCYSIANAASIDNVVKKWTPELKEHATKVPYILVGTKKDLRDDVLFDCEREASELRDSMVSTEQGKQLAKAIGAQSFHECSALYREGTRDVFENATKVALRKSRRKRKTQEKSCTIL